VFAVYRADVLVKDMVAIGCFSTGLLYQISELFMKCTVTKLLVNIIV